MAADEHHVRVRLGHARGDRADTDLADELYADAGMDVPVLEIVDEFRQVFDRINVMVRRRGNQADAGGRVTHLRDPRIHLGTGQFAAFAGLRALRHLDLEFFRLRQVLARHAEPSARDLFDREFLLSPFGIGW